jgi:hypothetical protein
LLELRDDFPDLSPPAKHTLIILRRRAPWPPRRPGYVGQETSLCPGPERAGPPCSVAYPVGIMKKWGSLDNTHR